MSNSDKSASARTRLLRNRTLAYYYDNNPNTHESATNTTFDASARTARAAGQYAFTVQHALKPNVVSEACCGVETVPVPNEPSCFSGPINFSYTDEFNPVSPFFGLYPYKYDCTWDPIPGATSYTLSVDGNDGETFTILGPTSGTLYSVRFNAGGFVTLTVTISGCPTLTAQQDAPCFLAGSLVTLSDGTTKPIEQVCVGDLLLGAFGEINAVLALHRPLLGTALMCRVNDEHSTTNHHPHISADKKFYCGDPLLVLAATYGRTHSVLLADNVPGAMYLHGPSKERILQLECGVDLKTVEGSRGVRSLETYSMPPETQLYNLVMGGSHTYHVDGYAVTGWPREDDFDYDTWTPLTYRA